MAETIRKLLLPNTTFSAPDESEPKVKSEVPFVLLRRRSDPKKKSANGGVCYFKAKTYKFHEWKPDSLAEGGGGKSSPASLAGCILPFYLD